MMSKYELNQDELRILDKQIVEKYRKCYDIKKG